MIDIIDDDLFLTIDTAIDNYVSDTDQISTYEIDEESVELVNGEIQCVARFDNDDRWYDVVLHKNGSIQIY